MRHGKIQILSINRNHTRCVYRGFHASLDFHRKGTGLYQLRQQSNGLHVLHAEEVSLLAGSPVAEPAGSCTAATISAASAQQRGHKAGTGIAVAHGAVDKNLQLNAALPPNLRNFPKTQLPGQDSAGKAQLLHQQRALRAGNGELCTGMNLQIRKCLPQQLRRSQILYDKPVHTCLIIGFYV